MTVVTRTRQIGPWGTLARIAVGIYFVAEAAPGVGPFEAVLGLVVLPTVVTGILALRGPSAPPLRLEGPRWHLANVAVFFGLWSLQDETTLLFYGASMLLAAWRGIGACEFFVVSNVLRRRDDQLGCPLFLPVDAVEDGFRARKAIVARSALPNGLPEWSEGAQHHSSTPSTGPEGSADADVRAPDPSSVRRREPD